MKNKIDDNIKEMFYILNEKRTLKLCSILNFDKSMYYCIDFMNLLENNLSTEEIDKLKFYFIYNHYENYIKIDHLSEDKVIVIKFDLFVNYINIKIYFGESDKFDCVTGLPKIDTIYMCEHDNSLMREQIDYDSEVYINNFTIEKNNYNNEKFDDVIGFIKIFLFKCKNISVEYSQYITINLD